MLKVDKATQTDPRLLRKPRAKTSKLPRKPRKKQQELQYIKPIFNILFDE